MSADARADALAARLRVIQADLADADPATREEHLTDEIERVLSGMVPDERRGLLDSLALRFPSWDLDGASGVRPVEVRSDTDRRELSDLSFLMKRLVEASKGLDDSGKDAIRRSLAEAGLSSGGSGEWPRAQAQRLREALLGGEDTPIDAGRALEVITSLSAFVLSLEKVIWRTWQQMAPRSTIRRRHALQKLTGTYLSGDDGASRGDLESALEELRQLTAGISAAVAQAGHLAWVRLSHLMPDEVMAATKEEGKKAWEPWEVAYWRRYKDLASTIDPATFESEVLHALADYVLPLIGRGRGV